MFEEPLASQEMKLLFTFDQFDYMDWLTTLLLCESNRVVSQCCLATNLKLSTEFIRVNHEYYFVQYLYAFNDCNFNSFYIIDITRVGLNRIMIMTDDDIQPALKRSLFQSSLKLLQDLDIGLAWDVLVMAQRKALWKLVTFVKSLHIFKLKVRIWQGVPSSLLANVSVPAS